MISLIIWLLLGFLAGYVAKLILPGADGGGLILTIVLGVVGAIVGGFLGTFFGFPLVSNFNNIGSSLPSFASSVVGAIVVLVIFRLASGRRVV
jgi:uncharacterized membrane protein YeaQ/YmgE (transglycosylase-associated protein family)